jgi:phosphoribulokinase
MSARHPIISVTGSSGAGTSTVKTTFEWIFRREKIDAAVVEGDAFHRYDRMEMRQKMKEAEAAGNKNFSHFGPDSNVFGDLEELFRSYSLSGRGRARTYIHDADEAARYGGEPGTFTPWKEIGEGSDLLIGVAPSINLEWIQKLHRDKRTRGYSTEAVVDTILRRMPDYVNYIVPQFSRTHINFQRVPTVDTSNPFIAQDIPTADESFLIVRFANPRGIDFPYLLSMIHDSFMSRPNTLVLPGGKLPLAMQIILTPLILRLMDTKKRAY